MLMANEASTNMMPQVDEIKILVAAQGSDTSMGGGNGAVQSEASNGKSTNPEILRRRNRSKITESDSSFESEPQIRSLSMKKYKYSQTKSRVVEVEQSDPTGFNAAFQSSELRRTSSLSRRSLSRKIKSMRDGILAPAEDGHDDDHDSSDDKEDGEAEKGEEKSNGKKAKPRKFGGIGGKLKAIDVVIEWMLFICAMVVCVASLYAHGLKDRVIWGLEIWKWCVLVAVIFCGRLVTKWTKDAIVFLIESKFLFNERVVYFLHGVKQSVRVVIWLALVLVAWELLIDRSVKQSKETRSKETIKVLHYITKVLVSSLIGAVMWMVKTLVVKLIAASFHVKTFFTKIREAIADEHALWTLSVPRSLEKEEDASNEQLSGHFFGLELPKWLSRRWKKEDIEQEKINEVHKKEELTLKKLGMMKPGRMPASTMGQLIDRIKSSKLSIVSSALEQSQKDIKSGSEAEEGASEIFQNVTSRAYIQQEDLKPFENKENEACLNEWFQKVSEEGQISKAALTEWVVNIYKQREYLAHSLKDAKTAIEELNRILSGIVLVLIVVVWLFLMGFATTKVLFVVSSQILLAGFMFGNTCRTLFEAMIFVFVMHPFDVGDRCVIDGVQMIVEEMDILKTAFLKYDSEMIYYPNAVLATKAISNFNRSPEEMGDSVKFDVDVSTSTSSIEALKAKIEEYIEGKSHHWHTDHSLQIMEIENMNKMKMVLFVKHKMNFQDFLQKMNRKTELMLALKNIFEEIGIKYHLLPQELRITRVDSAAVPASVPFV